MKKKFIVLLAALIAVFGSVVPANAGTGANNQNCLSENDGSPSAYWAAWDFRSSYEYFAGHWCVNNNTQDSTNKYRWVFQEDGNLVIYNSPRSGGTAVWSTGTFNTVSTVNTLSFQSDGNMVIYKRSRTQPKLVLGVGWASGKYGNPATMECYSFFASIRGDFNTYGQFQGNLIVQTRSSMRPSAGCPGTKPSPVTRVFWMSNHF